MAVCADCVRPSRTERWAQAGLDTEYKGFTKGREATSTVYPAESTAWHGEMRPLSPVVG